MGKKLNDADGEIEVDNGYDNANQPLKYEDKLKYANAIAQPMAPKKLNKKIIKLLKKAKEQQKKNLRFGLKDVQRSIQKGETGIVILAGDVTPIDVMCHIPGVCEEKNIPYCYTPSKRDLALAVGFTTSCLMALVKEHPDYCELYQECHNEIQTLGHPI